MALSGQALIETAFALLDAMEWLVANATAAGEFCDWATAEHKAKMHAAKLAALKLVPPLPEGLSEVEGAARQAAYLPPTVVPHAGALPTVDSIERGRDQVRAYELAWAAGGQAPLAAVDVDQQSPCWDGDSRELRLGGVLLRKFMRSAPSQEKILATFEELHWSARVDNPLPDRKDALGADRARDVVDKLNGAQTAIRFGMDGTGKGITWAKAVPTTAPKKLPQRRNIGGKRRKKSGR